MAGSALHLYLSAPILKPQKTAASFGTLAAAVIDKLTAVGISAVDMSEWMYLEAFHLKGTNIMNRLGMLLMLAAATGVGGLYGFRRDANAQETVAPGTRTAAQQDTTAAIAGVDDKTSGSNVRVSELIGMDIRNPAGEDIGEVSDLVVDARTGELKYAAVTYGGFLGFGNKLFAVPFKAFKFQREEPGDDDVVLVLNITQDQLDASEGFDKDRWPNFAEPRFGSDLDRRYGVTRDGTRQGTVDVDAGRTGVRVDVDD